jgi:hypothetical protein
MLPVFFVISFLFIPLPGSAAVTGVCSNCHTMHNSQNGTSVANSGGWGSGGLGGSPQSTPNERLLVTSCVGCHSSTTSSTIINLGSTRIPIVYNTVQPVSPLAGGNFYWVAQGHTYDGYGHNVYGIVWERDSRLSVGPGRQAGTCGSGTGACHETLADPPSSNNLNKGGCQGCHIQTAHHDDSKSWYRFLVGHDPDYGEYVYGVEDSDWEQDSIGHNKYQGRNGPVASAEGLGGTQSISSFCGGCHGQFHKEFYIGSASPWMRHPTDILLPNAGEYSGYDPVTNYSVEAPVAWLNPSAPDRTEKLL